MSLMSKAAVYQLTLSCGTLEITACRGDMAFDDLFDLAERRNPKRAFLFVSKV
ncbi:MAG TPA: adenine/guanine phosphoribosyltransferase, partial [Leclercia adecarboxylata]|nr:adenine/guanine phosphoribosyltransferase [Leclercia adecarboxylata]